MLNCCDCRNRRSPLLCSLPITSSMSSLVRWRRRRHWEPRSRLLPLQFAERPKSQRIRPRNGVLVRLFNPRQDEWHEHFERNGVLIVGRISNRSSDRWTVKDERDGSASASLAIAFASRRSIAFLFLISPRLKPQQRCSPERQTISFPLQAPASVHNTA